MPVGPDNESTSDRLNTIGLSRKQLDQILIPRQNSGAREDFKRSYSRWPYRNPSVPMSFMFALGSPTVVRVAARNISCGGISVLHSSFVYPGTRCRAILPCTSGNSPHLKVEGVVVRCQHMQGRIHEVGVRFDKPIDAKLVLERQLADGEFAVERVDPAGLVGRIVYADESEVDQRLIQHFLRDTSLRMKVVSTTEQAVAEVCTGCDLFIASVSLEERSSAAAVRHMRDQLPGLPMIVLTPDPPAEARKRLDGIRVNAILRKPITAERLLRAVAEFISLAPDVTAPDKSAAASRASGRDTEQLREQFYRGLQETIDKIERAVAEQDAMGAYLTCVQIKGICTSIGLESLARSAGSTAASLAVSMSVSESADGISALLSSCKHAKDASTA